MGPAWLSCGNARSSLNDGKKGHILVQIENNEGMWGGIFDNVAIGEVDWDGETVWSGAAKMEKVPTKATTGRDYQMATH